MGTLSAGRRASTSLIERLAVAPTVGQEARPFALSPDGRTIALQWYRDGNWQVFVQSLSGGEPLRVGEFEDACGSPVFSPDGRSLYFTRDDRGSECYDFYRYDLESGALENLLAETPGLAPLADFDLSPDGSMIALTVAHEDGYSVAIMPAAGAPRGEGIRHVSQHPYTESSPHWSPDGRLLAVACGTRGQDRAVFIIDAESGEREVIGGSDAFHSSSPAWSPDGRRLAFCGGPNDNPALGVYSVATGSVTWAWAEDLDAHDPVWAPDGGALAFLADCRAETGLCHLDLRSGEMIECSVGAGNHYAPRFSPDGRSLYCVFSGPDRPSDLYRIEVGDWTATAVTCSLPDDLRDETFVSGVHVSYVSRDHLARVPALLVEPDEPNGGAVIIVHGGPTWHHSNEWDVLRQAFVAAGVTVVHPNYRGSDGYGRRWQVANRWLMGQGEVLDVAGAWDFLVGRGCDPRRIAITGRSWGGFHVVAALTQFPDLWACGVAGVPFFDFVDSQLDTDIREDLRWWERENTGDLVRDRARLEYYSPINHLGRIEAPLLLLGGELDPRCPPRQMREVAGKLRDLGKTCDCVIYENEGHDISGVEHRLDYDRRTVGFILDRVVPQE